MARRGNKLAVWVNGIHAADWTASSRGDELQYTDEWVRSRLGRPISLSLPFNLDNQPIRGDRVRYYFDNLLPDTETLRQKIQLRYGTATQDPFDLLASVGRDCVGAVQLLPPGERPTDVQSVNFKELSEREIEVALREIKSTPALSGEEELDFRISIAGAQEKSAFLFHNGSWCRPLGSTPSTHIFKLPLGLIGGIQADMRGSVENEWLSARILHHYGVPVANCELARFGEQKVLIVQRFDRALSRTGKYWLRYVQEDFCQALAVPSSLKYESSGGPGISEIAGILQNSANRDIDLATFLRAQLIFWALAAGDGHAKNFSLRILMGGKFSLTPLYDVLSFWPIIGDAPNKHPYKKAKLAMALIGKNRHYRISEIRRKHFNDTAAKIGLGDAEAIIKDVVARTPYVADQLSGELPKDFPEQISKPILDGLQRSIASLDA